MKLTSTLTDVLDKTQFVTIDSLSTSVLTIASGGQSRSVDTAAMGRAVQNALNVGAKPSPSFVTTTLVSDTQNTSEALSVVNHPTDKNSVVVTIGSVVRTLNGAELQKAFRIAQQP